MASERAKAIEHELHGGHIMPGEALKNTGGCRCPRCVERRIELIDKALQEERIESARECLKIMGNYIYPVEMLDEIEQKFGLED